MRIVRTQEEIDNVLNAAAEADDENVSHYPGMSYEEGIREMYRWLVGETDSNPMAD